MTYALAPSHQHACGWNHWLPAREPHPSLTQDQSAEVVIVGAGYTGVAAARAWAMQRPDDRILLLDASTLGEGSPGRNSGFMLEVALANDASADQLARMAQLNEISRTTMAEIHHLVTTHQIDCQLQHSGTLRAACTPAGLASIAAYKTFLQSAGLRHEVLSRPALAERIGTDYYHEGLYSPDCYLVQPAALIRGLAACLPPQVKLYENTRVTRVHREGDQWQVNTDQAQIRAPQVILANNAFSRMLGADHSRLTAIYTYAAVTDVLPESVQAEVMPQAWGLLPAHRLGCTLRSTADGRLMIRSLYSYETEQDNTTVQHHLQSSFDARYPQLKDYPLTEVWGGTTGLTYNGAPVWGEIQPGLYVSAGCNGGGIVKGTFLGQTLAHKAMGQATPDIHGLFGQASWMPPEPVRKLGFHLIAALERRKASGEA